MQPWPCKRCQSRFAGVPQRCPRFNKAMVNEVALRPERLDVEAAQGRGKGRIKARASALALGTGRAGLELALSSKCDTS